MKKIIILLVLIVSLAAVIPVSAQERPLPNRPWREHKAERLTDKGIWSFPGCGVSGEFGGGSCPYDPWEEGFYEWFDPQLEFSHLYD